MTQPRAPQPPADTMLDAYRRVSREHGGQLKGLDVAEQHSYQPGQGEALFKGTLYTLTVFVPAPAPTPEATP